MANNQLLQSDNFASGSLAAGWSTVPGATNKCVVISGSPNVTEPHALSSQDGQIWTGNTWPNDHISELTIQSTVQESTTLLVMYVRMSAAQLSGYQVNISNGTVTLFRQDNGSATSIASASASIATGDVWVVAATGAVISVYRNGVRVLFKSDTTYTSGSPGYGQFSSSNLAHIQVGSWRGYSFVQTAGVWTKQQVVIPRISTDGAQGIANPHIFYDNNPQVVPGSTLSCFVEGVNYAESLDGITWVRYSGNPVIATTPSQCRVWKENGTYYMFLNNSTNSGVNLYTSTNKLNWTLVQTGVLTPGAAGQFDHLNLWNFTVVQKVNGTYSALYVGTGGPNPSGVGLATATNLAGPWTKYAGNPVINNFFTSAPPLLINGIWYAWGTGFPLGASVGANPIDPGQSARWQSTDLINWTNLTHSFGNTEFGEGVNANGVGLSYMTSVIPSPDGKKTFGYYDIGTSDTGSGVWQVALATAPAPPSSLVQFPENAAVQVATDSFARSAGGLGANWTTPAGFNPPQIASSGVVEPSTTSGTNNLAYYNAASFNPNQYSEITIKTLANTSAFAQAFVRMQANGDCYFMRLTGPTGSQTALNVAVDMRLGGVISQLGGAIVPCTPLVGDVFRLEVVTNPTTGNPVLTAYQNGYVLVQYEDFGKNFTSGQPGFDLDPTNPVTNNRISAWAGGNANVIPAYVGNYYSVPDCRVAPFGPNASRNVNSTLIYDVQTSSNHAIPPTDSRAGGAPVDSRLAANIPQNSRTPGVFGPNE